MDEQVDDGEMIEGGVLHVSEGIVQPPERKQAGMVEVDFDGLLSPPLKLHEDVQKGCGGQLWPAGMVLAKYLLLEWQRRNLYNKTIVELGAGGGLVSLAIALALRQRSDPSVNARIFVTDQEPMMALIERNVALNGLDNALVSPLLLDWAEPLPFVLSSAPFKVDIVLAADCVYFEPAFPLLLKSLDQLMGEKTVCFFCFKKRRRADMHFLKMARKLFNFEDVEDDPDRSTWSRQGLFLYRVTRKKSS